MLFIIRETRQPGITTEEHLIVKLCVTKNRVSYSEYISSQCFRWITFSPEAVDAFTLFKGKKPVILPGGEFLPDYITRLIVDLNK